ncbi:MAG: cation transporter [Desulfobacterales bacterium]
MTGSTSMVAEAVHSVADCGNQSLLLLGLNRSARLPNAEYPLGHGRAIKARMTENVSAPVMIEVINGCERALRARMRNLTIRRP